jgi:hypothetical protein
LLGFAFGLGTVFFGLCFLEEGGRRLTAFFLALVAELTGFFD